MNKKGILATLALACTVPNQSPVHGATLLGTTFTYQAQLKQAGAPIDGLADFKFSLWTLEAAGSQVGGTIGILNVSVDNGPFAVTLDFGAGAFIGDPRWLQIEARYPAGGDIVLIRSGNYDEQMTITKPVTLRATRGPATIGE